MSSRSQLPPPPPPVEIRAWPDDGAMLADRAAVLGELVRKHVSPGRLALLWLWGALCAIGWSLVCAALVTFQEAHDEVFGVGIALILAVMGLGFAVPGALLVAAGLGRDREVRGLLDAWGELARDPERDARLRMPGAGLLWLLPSYALCGLGLYLCIAVPATDEGLGETYGQAALIMGLGMISWITGLIGIVKAFAHRRWVMRVLVGAPRPEPLFSVGGGAHR